LGIVRRSYGSAPASSIINSAMNGKVKSL